MFVKVLSIMVYLAYSQAAELSHASSYSIFNSNHFQRIDDRLHPGPGLIKNHIAPIFHVTHTSPSNYVARVDPVRRKTPVVKDTSKEVYPNSPPHYSFAYGVQDANTGDIKNQYEERNGDVVKGVYSLLQPDGATRTVHYSADDQNGFNAQVEYSGIGSHQQILPKDIVAKSIIPNKTFVTGPVYRVIHN